MVNLLGKLAVTLLSRCWEIHSIIWSECQAVVANVTKSRRCRRVERAISPLVPAARNKYNKLLNYVDHMQSVYLLTLRLLHPWYSTWLMPNGSIASCILLWHRYFTILLPSSRWCKVITISLATKYVRTRLIGNLLTQPKCFNWKSMNVNQMLTQSIKVH